MKVLLVEDEQKIADFVCAGLAERGCSVSHCLDGNAGFEAGRTGSYEAIVLDLMLPGRDGLSVLAGLRSAGVGTPVLLLTARNALGDRIAGLNLGADDYLAKPFYVEELHARLMALGRRVAGERRNVVQAGPYTLDRITRHLGWRADTGAAGGPADSVELTAREYALLALLMRAPGSVSTRSQILEHVWGHDFDPGTNVVDVCVKRLRAKIAALAGHAELASPIESVRGAGYRFRPVAGTPGRPP